MKKQIISVGLLIALGVLTSCGQGSNDKISTTEEQVEVTSETTSEVASEAINEATSEAKENEEGIRPESFKRSENVKKIKSIDEIDEESIIHGEIGSSQMLAGGNLDGNTYQYSCKKLTGVLYPVILNTTDDQEIEIRSQLTMEAGDGQAYLLTADQQLIKIVDGTEKYSLKKGNNYLVLAGFNMKGKYEGQIIADYTVQIVSEAEIS